MVLALKGLIPAKWVGTQWRNGDLAACPIKIDR